MGDFYRLGRTDEWLQRSRRLRNGSSAALVAAATLLAISSVPFEKAGISNTPMGPFQTMVFAVPIFLDDRGSMVLGPISRPSKPSGVAETERFASWYQP